MAANPPANASRPLALLLVGPTGSGKTPLGVLLEERGLHGKKCEHFDFGDRLRELVRSGPGGPFRRDEVAFLAGVLRTGALLEDEHFPIAERVLRCFLADRVNDARTLVVLNGLPRHAGQAEAVEAIVDVRAVVQLECSAETVLQRIGSNIGGDRTGRPDDDPASVRKKLDVFHARTAPLVEWHRQRGARVEIVEVTAAMTTQQVWEVLSNRWAGP